MRNIFCLLLIAFVFASCGKEKKENVKLYDENSSASNSKNSDTTKPEVTGINIGDVAPNIILPDTSGKMVSLKSLRGKYVLIDFWASWCGPCRGENPNVVKMYKKYKDKGFEIYGVSLDMSKSSWISAIHTDGITWTQVSELKQWRSMVVPQFEITGIPATVLLDKEGKIIARDLRGEELEEKLKEVLK